MQMENGGDATTGGVAGGDAGGASASGSVAATNSPSVAPSSQAGASNSPARLTSPVVSTDLVDLPWEAVAPSLCRGNTRDDEQREAYYRQQISKLAFKVDPEQVVREFKSECDDFMHARDEMPISGYYDPYIRQPVLSICPFCLRGIYPGDGLHFRIVTGFPDFTDPLSRPRIHIEWIRNQREVDERELHPSKEYSRMMIEEFAAGISSEKEFKAIWYGKARSCVRTELKELYYGFRSELSFAKSGTTRN